MKSSKNVIYCTRCSEKLDPVKAVWLEFSNTDGKYYPEQNFPEGHISQGTFSFGSACASAQLKEVASKINNDSMNQEISINVKLTLDSNTELSKEEIALNIEAAFNTLFTSLNSPLSNLLARYKGGELLLETNKVEVIDVKTEAEIYSIM